MPSCDAPPKLYRGRTWELEVAVESAAGLPEDITGSTLVGALKKSRDDDDLSALLTFSYVVPPGADATKGMAIITVGSDQTVIPPGLYWLGIALHRPGVPPVISSVFEAQVPVVRGIPDQVSP